MEYDTETTTQHVITRMQTSPSICIFPLVFLGAWTIQLCTSETALVSNLEDEVVSAAAGVLEKKFNSIIRAAEIYYRKIEKQVRVNKKRVQVIDFTGRPDKHGVLIYRR